MKTGLVRIFINFCKVLAAAALVVIVSSASLVKYPLQGLGDPELIKVDERDPSLIYKVWTIKDQAIVVGNFKDQLPQVIIIDFDHLDNKHNFKLAAEILGMDQDTHLYYKDSTQFEIITSTDDGSTINWKFIGKELSRVIVVYPVPILI